MHITSSKHFAKNSFLMVFTFDLFSGENADKDGDADDDVEISTEAR